MMRTKVQKWGNSYAVRLPKQLVVKLGLRAGSTVQVAQEGTAVVVKRVPPKAPVTFKDWKKYLIPMKNKRRENVVDKIDEIVYGVSRR